MTFTGLATLWDMEILKPRAIKSMSITMSIFILKQLSMQSTSYWNPWSILVHEWLILIKVQAHIYKKWESTFGRLRKFNVTMRF